MKRTFFLCLFFPFYTCAQVITSIGGIINNYTPVLSFDPCKNKIIVEDASPFNIDDTVLIIQMKGAIIDSTNTSSFGTITNYNNVGNYELNYIKNKSGNNIELRNNLTRQYDIPDGKVQLIRVPFYDNVTVISTLTCLPWDGNKGGVLILNAKNSINMQADMDVTGKGFSGGKVINTSLSITDCDYTDYFFDNATIHAAPKGESITSVSTNIVFGRGALASGGGGGNGHNSGGGGGGNASKGGYGGYEYSGCNAPSTFDNRGLGGMSLIYNNSLNKIFLGGGGGAGHCNNKFNNPSADVDFSGGNGGGIIIISSNALQANNYNIISSGDNAFGTTLSGPEAHDGKGGGGAGGTILTSINTFINNVNIIANGGKGEDLTTPIVYQKVGPGGGGAGGVAWFNQNSVPSNVTIKTNGGPNGLVLYDNTPYGTTPGQDGINLFGLKIPIDNILFKLNIDSTRIKDSLIGCTNFDFKGLSYTNTNPIAAWQWSFGDGSTDVMQSTNYNYNNAGNFTVTLRVTDVNGCKDSVTKIITTTPPPPVKTSNDTAFCPGKQIQLNTIGASNYSWSPSTGLNNSNIANPIAAPGSTTQYIVTGTTTNGCTAKDTVNITIYSKPVLTKSADIAICKNSSAQLFASGGITYNWSPGSTLNNSSISNPVANPLFNTTYHVTITDANNCQNTDSITVNIRPDPIFTITPASKVCENNTIQLLASGGDIYTWQPSGSLDNSAASNPKASPQTTTTYSVQITDTVCNNTSILSAIVTVLPLPVVRATKSNDIDCSNDQSQLVAIGAAQYSWSPAITLNNPNLSNPIAKPTLPTQYIVKGTDPSGCINYDSITVNVVEVNKGGYLMPTAFSPNNDGKNDCYRVRFWGVIQELDFSIYNRWGERVFHTTQPTECWNGTYKGMLQDPGVFVYMIKAKTFCENSVFRKGTFVLIR